MLESVTLLFFLSVLSGCKNESQSSVQTANQGCDGDDCEDVLAAKKKAAADEDARKRQVFNSGQPDIKTVNNGQGFNAPLFDATKAPDEYKVPILGVRTPYYRMLFYDTRKNYWTGNNWFWGSLDSLADGAHDLFGTKAASEPFLAVTFHQPLAVPTVFPFDNDAQVIDFVHIGHTIYNKQTTPNFSTLMVIPSPYRTEGRSDKYIVAPAKDYVKIYDYQGNSKSLQENECIKEFTKKRGLVGADFFGDVAKSQECMSYSSLLADFSMGQSPTDDGQNYNNALDIIFDKANIALWKPIPDKGYQCLGTVATNGSLKKPLNADDNVNLPISQDLSKNRAACYCVEEKYLVAGEIKVENKVMENAEVEIYIITPKDNDGYGNAHMFHAVKKGTDISKEKVWVLAKKFLFVVPDPTFDLKTLVGGK